MRRLWITRPCGLAGVLLAGLAAAPAQLSAPPHPDARPGTVASYAVSPANDRVVFKMRSAANDRYELFVRNIDGTGAAVRLTEDANVRFFGPDAFAISPDGRHVVYEGGGVNQIGFEVYGRPIDAARPAVRLTPTGAYDTVAVGVAFRPGSRDLFARWDGSTTQSDRIYLVPADGSGPARQVSQAFPSNGHVVREFTPAPAGDRLVYLLRGPTSQRFQLHSADVAGAGGIVVLNDPAAAVGDHFEYRLTPDGRTAVYFSEPAGAGPGRLYSRRTDGSGQPAPIGDPFAWSAARQPFQVTPDGAAVLYVSDHEAAGFQRLFSGPVAGGASAKLTDHTVRQFEAAGGTGRVVYSADTDGNVATSAVHALFAQSVGGSGAAVRLNGGAAAAAGVGPFRVTPSGDRVVFLTDDQRLMYGAATAGDQPLSLLADAGAGRTVVDVVLAAGGRLAVFRQNEDGDGFADALYAVPVDGSASPVRLSPASTGGTNVYDFTVSPNGEWVVFRAEAGAGTGLELYSVQIPEPSAGLTAGAAATLLGLRRCRRRGLPTCSRPAVGPSHPRPATGSLVPGGALRLGR